MNTRVGEKRRPAASSCSASVHGCLPKPGMPGGSADYPRIPKPPGSLAADRCAGYAAPHSFPREADVRARKKDRQAESPPAARVRDRGPADLAATHRMLEKIRETYELYGFEAVETPFVEYTDALGKFLPDQDRPNEGVFSFQDD